MDLSRRVDYRIIIPNYNLVEQQVKELISRKDLESKVHDQLSKKVA